MITANLGLPLLAQAQAQKEVTHNEALRVLDVLVQGAVQDRTLIAPPAEPQDAQAWIVGGDAADAWTGHDGEVACWFGSWTFLQPKAGWRFWDVDAAELVVFDGSAWIALS